MNFYKKFFVALCVAGFGSAGHAAVYAVTGTLDGVDGKFPTPSGTVILQASFNPSKPAFTGDWAVDIDAGTFAGNMDFEAFSFNIELVLEDNSLIVGSGSSYNPHSILAIDTASAVFSYDSITRTFSFTQGSTQNIGEPATYCTGVMNCTPLDVIPPAINFNLSLIFDPTFTSFTGVAGNLADPMTGRTGSQYSFSGTAVPLPAGVWLFGSGLLGLSAVVRGKKSLRGKNRCAG